MTWRPRFMVYHNYRSPEGYRAWSFGVRIGFWPCLMAPFISFSTGPVSLDFWLGYPPINGKRQPR